MAQGNHSLSRRDPNAPAYALLRQLLVEARKSVGLTQQQLANRLGRPQSFVAKYEVGERYLDAIEFVIVAKILGVDIGEISEVIIHRQ
jgi:transcriptional regulator with XRE-family HTH domain